MIHGMLVFSCLLLLAVIAVQDYLVPTLRNSTISAGLTGPYHALLDAAYVPLAAALLFTFRNNLWAQIFATIAAVALLMVAATNTAWRYFDMITDGAHSLWHSRFTITVFVSALLLQVVCDHGWQWWLTVGCVLVPACAYCYFHYHKTLLDGVTVSASPAAEKLFVAGLCIWLILCAI